MLIGYTGGVLGMGGALFDALLLLVRLQILIGGVAPCEILLRSVNIRCISSWSPLSANEFSCLS